ncbi:MAG TPA: hypothetical protein VFF04_01375 [Candidatus Babeliales bacterium]|nr:hypothetical protein [Candidatus Babeliales bacterium]
MIVRKMMLILSLLLATPAALIVAEPNKIKHTQNQVNLVQDYVFPVGLAALAIYLASGVLSDIPVDADSVLAITALAVPIA